MRLRTRHPLLPPLWSATSSPTAGLFQTAGFEIASSAIMGVVADGPAGFELHPVRGRFNAAFFRVMDPYINWNLRHEKQRVFAGLPSTVVELGSGVGANFRYLPLGTRVIAIEPNLHMHAGLAKQAATRNVDLEVRTVVGERIDMADGTADAVISSLVLCTVSDPAAVLREVLRLLRPGGRYSFVEHVAATEGTPTRRLQHVTRRPWGWLFEGCSCERDIASAINAAGFSDVDIRHYRIHTPLVPFNPQVAGTAIK
jgi:SAM-dependent methyltransferase